MNLIISVMTNAHQVSRRSNNGRIPRLSNMEWFKLIIHRMMPVRIGSQFNELLSPIKQDCCNEHIENIFPVQGSSNEYGKNYCQNSQSKEMTPKKSGDLFEIFHRAWPSNHNHSSNLHPQNTIKFIKNIIINVPNLPGFLLKAIFLGLINLVKENIR